VPQFAKGHPRAGMIGTGLPDHDMVEDLDADDPARLSQLSRGADVRLGRPWITRGVRMRDHDSRGVSQDGGAKDIARRSQDSVQRSDPNQMKSRRPPAGVQMDRAEDFNLGGVPRSRGDVRLPVIEDALWTVAAGNGERKLTEADDPELVIVH